VYDISNRWRRRRTVIGGYTAGAGRPCPLSDERSVRDGGATAEVDALGLLGGEVGRSLAAVAVTKFLYTLRMGVWELS